MKKILEMAMLLFGVLIVQMPQAAAQEVFAYTEARRNYEIDHYVLTHTVQETSYGFKVQLHAVGRVNNSSNKYWEIGFTSQNGNLYTVLLPSTVTHQITSGDSVIDENHFKVFAILYKSGALNGIL